MSGFEREPTLGDAEWKIGRKGWRLGEMVCLAVRLTGGLVKWCCSYLVRWCANYDGLFENLEEENVRDNQPRIEVRVVAWLSALPIVR